jgi:methylmalonyl-CoA mutase N-terminal domain/subunit
VLGGCQSLHTNSMDEVLALPSEHAVTLALRTQQVLAHETGVTNTVDPLGGSYFVETLTRQMQQEAQRYFDRIEELGGMLPAIERGFFRREIAEASFAYQRELDAKRKIIVGVNAYQEADDKPLEILTIDHAVEGEQIASLRRVRKERSEDDFRRTLKAVRAAADSGQNIMPALLDAARARASVSEVMHALADVFGRCDATVV